MIESKKNIVVLATTNAGKVRELAAPLQNFGFEVVGLEAFQGLGDVEETGRTFEANALLKARTVADATGYVTVADDSGLEVEALGGAPGIYSARYGDDWPFVAGESRDARNIRKLLTALAEVPQDKRCARFVCCMAVCVPRGKELVVRGLWEGRILQQAQGHNGFGYDPVFFDPALGRSAALLTCEEKGAISHRGKALRQLLAHWSDFLESKA
ncbi:MAG: XTP/dITP diphosphatase [Desulfovibrionaceae bacterium]